MVSLGKINTDKCEEKENIDNKGTWKETKELEQKFPTAIYLRCSNYKLIKLSIIRHGKRRI